MLARLRGAARPDLLRQAIVQLLQELQPSGMRPDEFEALNARYGVTDVDGLEILVQLWGDALESLLSKAPVSSDLRRYMDDLQHAFGLTDEQVNPRRFDLVAPQYRAAVVGVLSDSRVTDEERRDLDSLAEFLGIPLEDGRAALDRASRVVLDRTFESFRAAGITPERFKLIRALQADLGVLPAAEQEEFLQQFEAQWEADEKAREQREVERLQREETERQRALERQARLAEELALIASATSLQTIAVRDLGEGAEPCHFEHACVRMDWRQVSPNRFDPRLFVVSDRGTLSISDKRIAFVGERTVFRAPHNRIQRVDVDARMCTITHRSGDVLMLAFELEQQTAVLAAVLARLSAAAPNT
jgi:hypothetical protein